MFTLLFSLLSLLSLLLLFLMHRKWLELNEKKLLGGKSDLVKLIFILFILPLITLAHALADLVYCLIGGLNDEVS